MPMRHRPKIAAVTTIYFKYSHTQHIVDRFLEGYGWGGRHHRPPMDLVSLFVDQVKENDLSKSRAEEFPSMKTYPTVAECLTLGGDQLAVDGILLIGEHGDYEKNEKGQTLYPRYELYKEIVRVFKESGRSVPVFNDKHLSWDWDQSREMYDISREMDFPFMAGSSLPVTRRIPALEMPTGAEIDEALCVCYGGVDSYDFHGLETIQCMVERRNGGETGVRWLDTFRGDRFWEAHHEGVWSRDLFEAALCRSHNLTPSRPGFNNNFPTLHEMKELVEDPIAYHYEHHDGLRCTMILMNGLVLDFNFAARLRGRAEPFSTQMYLAMPPSRTTLASFFNPLVNNIEKMFLTGRETYPLERTLLTSGLTSTAVDSLHEDQKRIETQHLDIAYAPAEESTFWID